MIHGQQNIRYRALYILLASKMFFRKRGIIEEVGEEDIPLNGGCA
jgi:hypothetical protein